MPSMSAHMSIAKRVSDKLNINDSNFIKGNLLPDLYDNKQKSHYKIKGKKYMIPNIDEVINIFDLKDKTYLGYLTHLLLDKYYLEEYLMNIDIDVFKDGNIYDDYDILNKDIIKHFDLDINYIEECIKEFPNKINNNKLLYNIECLNKNVDGDLKILDRESFISFLEKSSNKIVNDLLSIREKWSD